MNIIVSGWPGGGQSSLAIVLSYNLNLKLIRGSSTFRYLWKAFNLDTNALSRVEADKLIQGYWGDIYEKYINYLINNTDNFVLESDLGGFRTVDITKTFSIFLITDFKVRIQRLITDKRSDEVETLKERDDLLSNEYFEKFKIDFFNIEYINKYYSYLINNSQLTISKEIELVYDKLLSAGFIEFNPIQDLKLKLPELEKNFAKKGKAYYLELNESLNRIPTPEELIRDIKMILPIDVKRLPEPLKIIIDKI